MSERARRQAFRKRSEAQIAARGGISLQLDIQGLEKAIADAVRQAGEYADAVPELTARQLAQEIKGGRSTWRVDTGYSRSRFRGDKRGVVNDADYSPFLERKYGDAGKYTNSNINRIVQDVVKDFRA